MRIPINSIINFVLLQCKKMNIESDSLQSWTSIDHKTTESFIYGVLVAEKQWGMLNTTDQLDKKSYDDDNKQHY